MGERTRRLSVVILLANARLTPEWVEQKELSLTVLRQRSSR